MKKLLTLILLAALTILSLAPLTSFTPVEKNPVEKQITLSVTPTEYAIIQNALTERPFKEVYPLILKLDAQYQKQDTTNRK